MPHRSLALTYFCCRDSERTSVRCHPARDVVQTSVVDSTRWNLFSFRAGDVVIATFGKAGTTWVQQIVSQLIFGGARDVCVGAVSPWLEYRGASEHSVLMLLQKQSHRRFIKTHLPLTALRTCDQARYIYVARDPREQIWSAYHHLSSLLPGALLLRDSRYQSWAGSPPTLRSFYNSLLDRKDCDPWAYWAHVDSWWKHRQAENVLMLHFSELQRDLNAAIGSISEFLNIPICGLLLDTIGRHSSMEFMSSNADLFCGPATSVMHEGSSSLFSRSNDHPWQVVLSKEEVAKCTSVARRHLSAECVSWLFAS